jgi:8-oxo-dGTP pyrophosphatase MutT (NUDIX family)
MSPAASDSPPVSVKGVLLLGEGVLLLENERREWELPGGRPEPGEDPERCLAREFLEELALVVEVGDRIDRYRFEVVPGRHVEIVTHGCRLAGPFAPRVSREHTRWMLAPLGEVRGLDLPAGYARSVVRWAAMLQRVQTPSVFSPTQLPPIH